MADVTSPLMTGIFRIRKAFGQRHRKDTCETSVSYVLQTMGCRGLTETEGGKEVPFPEALEESEPNPLLGFVFLISKFSEYTK